MTMPPSPPPPPPNVRRRLYLATLALVLTASACGTDGPPTRESSGPKAEAGSEPGRWTGQVLDGEPGPDHPTQVAVDGDQVVVTIVSDEGDVTGFASNDEGRFQPGETTATGHQFLGLGGLSRFGEGWIAMGSGGLVDHGGGDEELLFDMRTFRSDDGRTWAEFDSTGLDAPADVFDLIAVDDGLVAVGTLREAGDPSQGGFRAVAWHSTDGEHWTTVPMPAGGGSEGSAATLLATGDEVLAVGSVDRRGVMWSSTDGGATWAIVEREGIPATSSLDHIVSQDDVLLVSGRVPGAEEGDAEAVQVLVRSVDGGQTWRDVTDPPPPNRGEPAPFPLFAGGGRFFTLGFSFIEPFSEPELCYADIELCRQDTEVALYVSDDGDRWDRVDLSGLSLDEYAEVDGVAAPDDGRVVLLTGAVDGVGTWTWPAGVDLPTEAEPVDPTSDVDILDEGEALPVGERRAYPLYIHCGMEWLYEVDGTSWRRTDDGPDTETGAGDEIPDDWPVAQQAIFGFVTRVSEDRIEYSIGDDQVIATYSRSAEQAPGCM